MRCFNWIIRPDSRRRFLTVPGALTLALIAFAAGPDDVQAEIFSFDAITNNDPANVSAGEAQLRLTVAAGASNTVDFTFTAGSTGQTAMSITSILFEDSSALLVPGTTHIALTSSPTVRFQYAKKQSGTLDGSFSGTAGLSIERVKNPADAVHPGQFLTANYQLTSGGSFNDLITALNNGTLRVGMHVQAMGTSGKSEKFVNGPQLNAVPEPSTVVMTSTAALLGLAVTALRRRRKA